MGWVMQEQGHEVRLMPAQYVKPYVCARRPQLPHVSRITQRASARRTPLANVGHRTSSQSVFHISMPRLLRQDCASPIVRNSA